MSVITDNRFEFPGSTSNYPLVVAFNSLYPIQGAFSNNIVIAELCPRPLQIGGTNSTINGNTLINNGVNDFVVSAYSTDCVFSGNIAPNGSIRLETQSGGNVVVGNGLLVSDVGTANIVANNR